MDKNEYFKKIKDSNIWFDYSKNQRYVAESILHNCITNNDFQAKQSLKNNNDFIVLWSNVHYHFGIAIENGLKGIIIKYQPESIVFEVRGENVILKNVGGHAGKTHNLLKLAETAGVFDSEIRLFKYQSDYESLKRVLLHLSDMIKWGARYPVPNNLESVYKFDNAVPLVTVYGFHILDVIQPLFDYFENERS